MKIFEKILSKFLSCRSIQSILNFKYNKRLKKDIASDADCHGIRNSTVDEKIITPEDLLAGDFLFCRPSEDHHAPSMSGVIQSVTGGYYTHCAIYISNDKIIHAVSPCVEENTLESLIKQYRYIVAVRIHGNDKNKERTKKIVDYAKSQLGKKYNKIDAARSPSGEEKHSIIETNPENMTKAFQQITGDRKEKDKLFCSQLVMEAIYKCGYISEAQAKTKYLQSEYWTPTGLAKRGYGDMFRLVGYLSENRDQLDQDDYFISGTTDMSKHL